MNDLEEQRDFLLRSLEDLEREHDAGDVDDVDYQVLKDDYTARAAAVLRAIDAEAGDQGAGPSAAASGRSLGRTVAIVLGVLAFAGLAGVLVAQASGRRDSGELSSGDVRRSITQLLNEAQQRFSEGDSEGAIELYDEVLADQPTNAEALTYKGWLLTITGQGEEGLTTLLDAATTNRDYPDVHAFLAIVFFRSGLVEQADRELDRLEALDPPADVLALTEGLRAQIDAALATASTVPGSTTTAPPAP